MENSESTSLLHLLYIYLPHLAKNIKKKTALIQNAAGKDF